MKNTEIKIYIWTGGIISVVLSAICCFFSPICALICLACGISITTAAAVINYRRIRELCKLNDYLSLVCAGRLDLDISSNTEGEMSILRNNLYKVIVLLRSQNEALKKDKTFLADSLSNISHQLKTPLTSIMVMSDLLDSGCDEKQRKEFLSIIRDQLEKMRWMIATLLKISRFDAGMVSFDKKPISVRRLIDECILPFGVSAELKDITIAAEFDDFDIVCDENWTVEAVENIIKNCIEHTDSGGKIIINAKSTAIFDTITVSDNGCGIDEDDLAHIFDRFYKGKNSSADSVGIGLALSKSIIEEQGGGINVQSTPGSGTGFEIRFYKSIV